MPFPTGVFHLGWHPPGRLHAWLRVCASAQKGKKKKRNISPKKTPWLVAGCLHTPTTAERPSALIRGAFPEHPRRPTAFYCVGLPQGSAPPATTLLGLGGGDSSPAGKAAGGRSRAAA